MISAAIFGAFRMREIGGGLMKNIVPNNYKPSSYPSLYDMELDRVFSSIAKSWRKNILMYISEDTLKPN